MHLKYCFSAIGFCIPTILKSRASQSGHVSWHDTCLLYFPSIQAGRVTPSQDNICGCQITDDACVSRTWLLFETGKLESNIHSLVLGVLDLSRCTLHVGKHPVRNLKATFYIFQGQIFPAVYSVYMPRAKFSILL